MSEYPEHEKLHKVTDRSQAIGTFLDTGVGPMNLCLYERRFYDCECDVCNDRKAEFARWHTQEEKDSAVDGRVQIENWVPTQRTIDSILAEYFGIDLDKIDAEKADMLARLRA